MDPNVKTVILTAGTVVGTILAAIAAHGEKAVAAMAGVPPMLRAWSDGLPLGVWSFLLAIALATVVWLTLIVKLKPSNTGRLPHFSADTITLFVAIFVTVSQQAVAETRTAGAVLNALSLGALAGLGAPYIGRGIRALFRHKGPA